MANAQGWMMTAALSRQCSRRGLMKGSLGMGFGAFAMAALGGSFTAQAVSAAPPPLDSDLDILNYALTLERLEAAAYAAINSAGLLSGRAATYFQAFGTHETAHRDALIATIQKLGGTPVPERSYNFSSVPKDQAGILMLFQRVETVGASAYLGAAPAIQSREILAAALSIHAVEGEHASALAALVAPGADLFAPEAFATPRTPVEVMDIVAPFFATAQTAPPPAAPANVPSAPPRTGGGDEAHFLRRLGDG